MDHSEHHNTGSIAGQQTMDQSHRLSSSSNNATSHKDPNINTIQVSDLTGTFNGKSGLYSGSFNKVTKKPHGDGRIETTNQIYTGQWVDGDWSGFGVLKDKHTGNIYEGGFFDNMKHGHGVLKYADGRQYDGTFQLDRMGKGKMTYVDGTTFWGYYDDDCIPHGRGKFTYTDGSVYDGEFEHGIVQGHGRMTYTDGRWYLGEWMDGEKDGIGMEVMADGSLIHEGTFCHGSPIDRHSCTAGISSSSSRRKSSDCLVYPSSFSVGSTNTLVGPLPKRLSMKKPFLRKNRTQ